MEQNGYRATRRALLIGMVTLAALPIRANAETGVVTVHRDPNCGCCLGWVRHLRKAGFVVQVEETSDLESVRTGLGVPPALAACHTAEVNGYLIEGHVPAVAVRRLLAERPDAKGLSVPGMPAGSPGMEGGGEPQPYTVVLFGAGGVRPFMRFVGQRFVG
ncbi:DUF411 domain-containing protein [Bradyrhizobium sp.]|uniref:DUF411 domain-containing protein n=1 Tax=Bradyrhizobium sp. TaxID=376 RepID=UPI004037AA12